MSPPTRIPGIRSLHSPGPTHVPDEVIAAMSRQPTDLGDPRVAQVIAACESGLRGLLHTERAEVFFFSANGHGGWEAVIANLVAPGTHILVPGTGHFSDGWAEQVVAYDGVALRGDSRKTTGRRLTYFGADERYLVTGAPVTIVDECARETTGRTLTFYRATDRIVVDGNEQIRTQTRSASACP